MKYFVDHDKKSIHRPQFAGDRCGFTSTPVEQRKFSNGPAYVEGLIRKEHYRRCTYCISVQTALTDGRKAYAD